MNFIKKTKGIYYWLVDYKLDYLLLALLVIAIFTWLQMSPTFLDPDSFYHAKIAELMKNNLVIEKFDWLQGTSLNQYYTDHHWLYHLFLIPFVTLLPALIGIKVFQVIIVTILMLYLYYWLKSNNGHWPFFFMFIILSCLPFIHRLNLVKVPALSLIILFISLSLAQKYKYFWLFIISIIYVWLYGGFLLLPTTIAIFILIDFFNTKYQPQNLSTIWQKTFGWIQQKLGIISQLQGRRWFLLLASSFGVVIGFITHPYWPKNLFFYYEQIFNIALKNVDYQEMNVGAEWYPYNIFYLLSDAGPLFVVLALSILIILLPQKKFSLLTKQIGALTLMFLVMTLLSRRHVEYFIPFGAIFVSLLWRDQQEYINWPQIKKWVIDHFFYLNILVALVIVLLFVFSYNLWRIKELAINGIKFNELQNVSTWLSLHTPDNSLVINDRWSDWPMLFYHNTNNNYLFGLDPRFMQSKYPDLALKYTKLVAGENVGVKEIIKDQLRGDYLLVNNKSEKFINLIENNIYLRKVYQDQEARVYQIQ